MTASRRWLSLMVLGLFFFMVIVDGSIVTIAIPAMATALHVGTERTNLVIGIYLVVISAFLLPFGRLGDRWGRIQLFKYGMIGFLIGSWLAGAMSTLSGVLIARAIQAIGASMVMANSYAIVTDIFPREELGRAFGIESIFISLGALAGPGLGGLILSHWSWSYIFWINLPVGVVCVVLAWWIMPNQHRESGTMTFDWLGTLELIGMAASFYAFSATILAHVGSAMIWLLVFVILLSHFWWYEQRIPQPLLDAALFRNRQFRLAITAAFLSFVAAYFFTLIAPIYLQLVVHESSQTTGLVLIGAPLVAMIANPLAGAATDRWSKVSVMKIGMSVIIMAAAGVLTLNGQREPWMILIWSGLSAVGTALFGTANNTYVMSSVTVTQRGMAGAINSLIRECGLVLGTTLASVTFYGELSLRAGHRVTNAVGQSQSHLLMAQLVAYGFALGLVILAIIGTIRLEGRFVNGNRS